jgi:hypothetical protein
VLATGVIAIPTLRTGNSAFVKVFNLVLQINKQTDDSALLDIQTRLSDKQKREISDCFNDTLTNPCGQKFAKTTLPSNTENMSNVGSNENNLSDFNTTDVDFLFADTDLQALFDNDFELEMFGSSLLPICRDSCFINIFHIYLRLLVSNTIFISDDIRIV